MRAGRRRPHDGALADLPADGRPCDLGHDDPVVRLHVEQLLLAPDRDLHQQIHDAAGRPCDDHEQRERKLRCAAVRPAHGDLGARFDPGSCSVHQSAKAICRVCRVERHQGMTRDRTARR